MIRVLIVEDEPPIARMLAKMIEPHQGFDVVDIQYDGHSAVERLREGDVDVVFTDIRMPVMDGLELLEHIHRSYPQILSVILTGYQDFDYAKKAISYQAFDYILKPLSAQKAQEILDRLEEGYRSKTRDRRRKAIQQYLAGERVPTAKEESCIVVAICAGAMGAMESELYAPGQVFWSKTDLEEILELISSKTGAFLVFNGLNKGEKIVVCQFVQPERSRQLFHKLYQQLIQQGKMPITMIGHELSISMNNIYSITRRLHDFLTESVRLYASEFHWVNIEYPPALASPANTAKTIQESVEAICKQDPGKLKTALQDALMENGDQGILQNRFMDMIRAILEDERITVGIESAQTPVTPEELEEAVCNAINAGQLCDDLVSLLITSKSDAKKPMREIVNEIERFLIAHYNKPITHEMLATRYGFVPSYISKIFRQYKEVSPSEYLIRYRMDHAKKILASRPDVLIKDVAETVGYENPYYFSKLFKRETGHWPTEYIALLHQHI